MAEFSCALAARVRAAIFVVLVCVAGCSISVVGIRAEETTLEAMARAALTELFTALQSGDRQRVDPLLAPEFQVVRSDGSVYLRRTYLERSIPVVKKAPIFNNVTVTQNQDIVVVTLRLQIDEIIDGKTVESNAPQMFVFRVVGDTWQVVASANLAKLSEPE